MIIKLARGQFLMRILSRRTHNLTSKTKKLIGKVSYVILLTVGTTSGLLAGYVITLRKPNTNETLRNLNYLKPSDHLKPNIRENSPYKEFPFKITLYKYERCVYCEQLKTYLDFFGFEYDEVYGDTLTRTTNLLSSLKQLNFPLCLIEDKKNNKKWYLSNATNIISALETLRNENYGVSHNIMKSYLPTLSGQDLIYTKKYKVSDKSCLNDLSLRKWINNVVIPTFKWNSCCTLGKSFETIDLLSKSNQWNDRFSYLKCLFIYYNSVYKLYMKKNFFKDQLLENAMDDAQSALDDIISKWEELLNNDEISPFSNRDGLTLADLSLFGIVRAFREQSFLEDVLIKHKKFSNWYQKMIGLMETHPKSDARFDNLNVDWLQITSCKSQTQPENEKIIENGYPTTNEVKYEENLKNKPIETHFIPFRILSLNYLIHVLAFTYAAFMKSS